MKSNKRQFLVSFFIFLSIIFLDLFSSNLNAQIDISIGSGTIGNTTTTYPCPIQDYFEGSRAQYLYTAAELTAAGMSSGNISAVKFNVISVGTAGISEQYTIKIGGVSTSSLSATSWETGAIQVYGPQDYQPVAGINTFTFTSPFFWNGSDNILIEICNGDPNNATSTTWTSNPVISWTTGLSFNGSHTYRVDGLGNLCATTTTTNNGTLTTRPNIVFSWTSSVSCTGTPTAGNAVSTLTNILCAGTPISLSLTGVTLASGLTYQWQSSTDNIVWTNITGATNASHTTIQTLPSLYYRCIVRCTSSNASSNSTSVQVTSVSGPSYTTLPYSESFEATWINSCNTRDIPNNFWKNTPISGNNSWRRNDDGVAAAGWTSNNGAYTPTASDGSMSARFHSYDASSGSTGSFDLYVNCNTASTQKRLLFDYINTSGSDTLTILVSTDGGTTFSRLDSARLSSAWRTKTVFFTSTSATTVLRFRATSDFGVTDIGIDNIRLDNWVACSGTPTGGIAIANPTLGTCSPLSVALSLSGASVGSGITYQWQSSIDSLTWTNIPGATNTQYTNSQTATTLFYRCITTCTNSAGTANSNGVKVVLASGPTYATLPYFESFEATWINSCSTRDIPNNFWKNTPITGNNSWRRNDDGIAGGSWTNNNGAYTPAASDGTFSARFHSFQASSGTNGTLDLYLNCNTPAPLKRLLFDYINISGTDSLSLLISTDGGTTFTRFDSVGLATAWRTKTIFFTSTSATTVLRFRTTSDFGASDIGLDNIRLNNWADCSGTPIAGTANANPTTGACANTPVLLSVTGATDGNGITYQWQSSTNGGTTWTNIVGATSFNATVFQVVTTQYRCVVNCTLSSTSTNSTAVTVVSPALPGGTYTIDNSLPTNWTGATGNFNSFNDAYNAIKCGISSSVVFNVQTGNTAGIYTEQLIMNAVPGANATRTVTFNGNGKTLTFASSNTNERAVIKLKGAKYIIFDSLKITATGTFGFGVQLTANADSNIVRKCIINTSTTSTVAANFAGIVISGSDTDPIGLGTTTALCDFNTIHKNTIIGGYYGITLTATFAGGANGNNIITNNDVQDFYMYGMYINGSYSTLIEGNKFSRPTRTSVGDFQGIFFTAQSNTAKVSKNIFFNPFGGALTNTTGVFYGINFSNCSASSGNENNVTNNLIHNVNGNGPINALMNTSSANVWYFHNTVSLDDVTSTSTQLTRGFNQTGTAGGLFFYDNLISITRGGTGIKHCIYLATNILGGSDNNNYFINAPSGTNSVGYYTSNRTTINDWKAAILAVTTAAPQEQASISSAPVYTDPSLSVADFRPNNSAMDNKGLYVGIDDDITNTVRSQTTPDIGAYEFVPSPCTLPINTGTTTINVSTVCQNTPVILGLTIGAYGSSQTFQWQTSTSPIGPFTSIGTPMPTPDTTILSSTTLYYQCLVKCGSATAVSNPVLLNVNPALPSGTYTINSSLPNTYIPGVVGGNFPSFNDAKAAMSCGVVGTGNIIFSVQPGLNGGVYNEQLKLDSIRGVNVNRQIVFKGNGNRIAFNPTNNNERAIIKLNGADYINFDSLKIDASAATTFGYGIQLINNADSNTVRNCTILASTTQTSTSFAGIVINASDAGAVTTGATFCDGNTFTNDTISGGYYGVTLVGSATQLVNNNKFTNNIFQDFYNYGFYAAGTNNTLIEGNTFTRPTRTAVLTAYPLYFTAAVSNQLKVSKNRITKLYGGAPTSTAGIYGIYHNSVDASIGNDAIISNNLFYNLDGLGPVYGLYNIGSNNIQYLHNTISIDNATAAATTSVGLYQSTDVLGVQFINNIVTIRRAGTGVKQGIYLGSTTTDVVSNYNDFLVTGTSNAFVGFRAGTNYNTLAAWTSATTKDANSVSLDPLYIDTANGNYKPAMAPLDNKGKSGTGITNDIINVTRSTTTPDIGAYEYSPLPCATPLLAGVASVTPNSGVCLEAPIRLSLTGNSPLGNITFQWQASTSATGPWVNYGVSSYSPTFDSTTSVTNFYRCAVTCNGVTTFSTVTSVTLNSILLAGTYTIDASIPQTWPGPPGTNFQTMQGAVNALTCGISGSIIFNVKGTYNEQIRIPYIPGTSATSTVTFQSWNGQSASAQLTFNATNSAANYTLRLDSTRYFTFRNMTISAVNSTNGRVVEFANTASFDSLRNCVINSPTTTNTSTTNAAVFANALRGNNLVIKGNTINNGSSGIYLAGNSALVPSLNHLVDSNFINGSFIYNMYLGFCQYVKVNRNTLNIGAGTSAITYGLYVTNCDSSFEINNNKVNINNSTGTVYGMFITNSNSSDLNRGKVTGNDIIAATANSSSIYGMWINNAPFINVLNNTIALNTTGGSTYGLYSNNTGNGNYYNNSINNTATSAINYSAYFNNTSATGNIVRNNIFSNKGAGKALFTFNSTSISSDYNMLFTTGTVLAERTQPTAANYPTLEAWKTASSLDVNSIVYNPAFVSDINLKPDVTNSNVWAIHGRGVQLDGNNFDHDAQPRPVTLTAGVPDLGAYEFYPSTVLPTVLTATPAAPAANTEQTFMYGTDTVMKIKWGAVAPPSVQVRRYSGVVPTGVSSQNLDSMYFYTKVDIPGGGNYDYDAKLFYIDPWLGSIGGLTSGVYQLGLGKTTAANAWIVGFTSRNNVPKRMIYQTGVSYLDRFTGLLNPYAPPVLPDKDSSNRGRRFWVAYPINQLAGTQNMVLYLSAQEAANVQVKINGTNWVRNYTVPANTVIPTDIIPKAGADNAFLNTSGLFDKGISINSDVPIVAYAHVYGSASSGASMLLPVGVWGYEYKTLCITGSGGFTDSRHYFYVIADNDNTRIQVTPSVATSNTSPAFPANTATTVTLNKGQVLLISSTSATSDLTGSVVKSIPNNAGKCFPIAVFSGQSRLNLTLTGCTSSGGDFIMQQNFPSSAWGKRYLLTPTSFSTQAGTPFATNAYRVAVKNPTTVVKRNGTTMTGLISNHYYEFTSNSAEYIEADQPIMVAQFTGDGTCSGGTGGVGDPEMFYISPIEQGINKVGFYRNTLQSISQNLFTLVVPTNGLASLQMSDGATPITADFTYAHPANGLASLNGVNYTVVVKRLTSAQRQVIIQCDSNFTGITYGLGSVESYGYNIGTLVKNLQALGNINNTLNPSGNSTEYTCAGAPFRFTMLLPVIPTMITWKFSQVPFLTPNTDTTITSPVPTGTVYINGTLYYKFTIAKDYVFSNPGLYPVQVVYSHPTIESCDQTQTDVIYVQVIPSPAVGFTFTFNGCSGNTATFTADNASQNGIAVNQWNWTFNNNTTATGQIATFLYPNAGTFTEKLNVITSDGCIRDSSRQVIVNPTPVVNVITDSFAVCKGTPVTFTIQNPATGVVYNWFTAATGGSPIFTGSVYVINSVTKDSVLYIEAVSVSGCTSVARKRVIVKAYDVLVKPVVSFVVASSTPNSLTFSWGAVPGALTYQVSINGGTTWITPSSGVSGLTHVISGLQPNTTVSLLVKALAVLSCQTTISDAVVGKTLIDQIFVPNAFNPNSSIPGNRTLKVYGFIIQSMQFMIFNQWGEKVFESTNQSVGWDGNYKGKPSPSGVYIYVLKMTLTNGTTSEMKGSISLIR